MERFMNLKLHTKLMLFFSAITLIPLLFLGLFTYQVSSKMVKEQASNGVMEKLTQINKNVAFFSRDIEQLSNYIYRSELIHEVLEKSTTRTNKEKYQDFKKVNELFDSVLGTKTWNINLYILGVNGDRYFTGDYLPIRYNDIQANWGIFRKAEEGNGAAVWDTHYTTKQTDVQEVVLRIGRLIKNPQSEETIGYVIIDILESSIAELYQSDDQNSLNQLFLLDAKGYVISSFPSKATIGMRMQHGSMDNIMNSQSGVFQTKWNNENYMAIFDTNEETHYKIASFLPERIIAESGRTIKLLTILLIGIGFIVAIWFSYFLSLSITKPVNRLTKVMKKVEDGDLNVRFQARYEDEISGLGRNFNKMIVKLNTTMKESLEKQTRLQRSEIQMLRAQINPHFLYNTLETISAIAKIKGVRMISELAVALGEMMRYSIKKDNELVRLEEDLLLLERYLYIQEVRFQDKMSIDFTVDEDVKQLWIPPLLIQPIVENAIIHGLEPKIGKGTLSIHIFQQKDILIVEVKDDGVGIHEQKLKNIMKQLNDTRKNKKLGIGLENVKKRIALYFGDTYGIFIDSVPNMGATVQMRLPILKEK
ncbi:sensor histidine kinase [Bacillus sp. FJAT-50079]|uniref:cache domain-containing sensor histidine kinase n=1 Tax=Bacillus sp. FJAT-50079 TaxID=2833577 RepID=UPI001BC9E808|nr:sensor histidine kinase [Bacillus sp. FJAT-50079]MBS4209361.1 sensor histidine kinase [Bacillus sp. FJAT-50079]